MPKVKKIVSEINVDAHVGRRIRLRRTLLGMSQQSLGAKLGMTFQQIQKYEKGTNRISASTLHRISEIMGVPVAFFFDDMDTPNLNAAARELSRRDLEIARHLQSMPDDLSRKVLALIRSIATNQPEGTKVDD